MQLPAAAFSSEALPAPPAAAKSYIYNNNTFSAVRQHSSLFFSEAILSLRVAYKQAQLVKYSCKIKMLNAKREIIMKQALELVNNVQTPQTHPESLRS